MKSNPSFLVVHPLRSGEILRDISTGSLRPLVPLQLGRFSISYMVCLTLVSEHPGD